MSRYANMKKRLARLASTGLRVAPVVESLKGIKRGGHFRVYSSVGEVPVSGALSALVSTLAVIKKHEPDEVSLIQRLPCDEFEFNGVFRMTTRDTLSGESIPSGKFRVQGKMQEWRPIGHLEPKKRPLLKNLLSRIEKVLGDVFEVDLGLLNDKFFILSVVPAPRTFRAALRVISDLVEAGAMKEEDALLRLPADVLKTADRLDVSAESAIATGLPAAPGIAVAKVAWNVPPETDDKSKPILVVSMTTPEHVEALKRCSGIITKTGGFTSHAAVIARQMGLPCIVSAVGPAFDALEGQSVVLSMDGNTGRVYEGPCDLKKADGVEVVDRLLKAHTGKQALKVLGNADNPADVEKAVSFGAEGIGLCRTEHQFFDKARINIVRRLLLAATPEDRRRALSSLLVLQRTDFMGMLKAAKGFPVTIRLLDAPLHEFLPSDPATVKAVADEIGVSAAVLSVRVKDLHEENPMLGYRGCRVGIVTPDIYAMQTQAIAEAVKMCGVNCHPKVMIPLIATVREFAPLRALVLNILQQVLGKSTAAGIPIGTMIETPRACVTADELAKHADFFSFGTNDLTQMTWGFSRDDVGKFLPSYREREILMTDPFESLDVRGVGRLIRMAVDLGRAVKPDLDVGICGEHGGDPRSIVACANLGMDYVSCSPYRVKTARLAAIQVYLRSKGGKA